MKVTIQIVILGFYNPDTSTRRAGVFLSILTYCKERKIGKSRQYLQNLQWRWCNIQKLQAGTSSGSRPEPSEPVQKKAKAGSKPKPKAIPFAERPRVLLPDTAVLLEREFAQRDSGETQGDFVISKSTRNFAGIFSYFSSDSSSSLAGAGIKAVLAIDWYQTLDRSSTTSTWDTQAIPWPNVQFLQDIRDRYEDKVLVAIVSFIRYSDKNRQRLIEALNNSPRVLNQGLVASAIISTEKVGALGKKECIRAITQNRVPACLIDDNADTIRENVEFGHGGIHVKLRKKPYCPQATAEVNFLEQAGPAFDRWLQPHLQ